MYDYTLSIAMTELSNPHTSFSVIWNNFSPKAKYLDRSVDALILNKAAPGSLPESEFAKALAATDPANQEALRTDRYYRAELVRTGNFDGHHYTQHCDFPEASVYRITH